LLVARERLLAEQTQTPKDIANKLHGNDAGAFRDYACTFISIDLLSDIIPEASRITPGWLLILKRTLILPHRAEAILSWSTSLSSTP
jgi:hypothetical protein